MFRGPVIISALLTTTESVRRGGGASSYVYLKVYRHDGRAAEPKPGSSVHVRPARFRCMQPFRPHQRQPQFTRRGTFRLGQVKGPSI
jgi:hypothetical protein